MLVQLLWKTVWGILKKLKIELPGDPAMPLLVIYLKEMKTGYQRGYCTPMFFCSIVYNSQDRKQPKDSSVNKWIKKMWDMHSLEYYSVTRKKEILSLTTLEWTLSPLNA